ncbi:MAG: DUF6471 domain-containing protein, partial [Methylocella sp.]
TKVSMPAKEKEYADRIRRFIKAELKRADVSYEELAERLTKHGFEETKIGIASKLSRGTFSATFFLACLAALELDGIRLEDI